MKIDDLLKSVTLFMTNEEKNFVETHGDNINLLTLDDHGIWVAQNLVRKGIYEISNSDKHIVKVKDAQDTITSISED